MENSSKVRFSDIRTQKNEIRPLGERFSLNCKGFVSTKFVGTNVIRKKRTTMENKRKVLSQNRRVNYE